MERLIHIYTMVAITAGTISLLSISAAFVVWSIRCITRSIVEMRYAVQVKYYIKDTYNRIVDYDRRIKDIEETIPKLRDEISQSWRI